MLLFRNHCLTVNGNSLTQVLAIASIFYPLKSSGNQRFSGVFGGYKMGTLVKIGLGNFYTIQLHTPSSIEKTLELLQLNIHFSFPVFHVVSSVFH